MCPAFFFFNDTATTEIYTLSLHDALPISGHLPRALQQVSDDGAGGEEVPVVPSPPVTVHQRGEKQRCVCDAPRDHDICRSEEHTSELQSRQYLVCRLLLEKKNTGWSPDQD